MDLPQLRVLEFIDLRIGSKFHFFIKKDVELTLKRHRKLQSIKLLTLDDSSICQYLVSLNTFLKSIEPLELKAYKFDNDEVYFTKVVQVKIIQKVY